MLCQFCGQHEATNKFLVNFMGSDSEVYICDECLENFSQFTQMHQQAGIRQSNTKNIQASAWPLGFSVQGTNGKLNRNSTQGSSANGLDSSLANEIRTKRELNQLYKQLKVAVDSEKYEEAAKLRDEINTIKRERYIW